MRGRPLAVMFATALMSIAALPPATAGEYDGGFVKTRERGPVLKRPDSRSRDLYQVGKRGRDHYRDGGRYREDRHKGYRGHQQGRTVYVVPSYRYYDGPYRHHHHYRYGDYLGVFLLGGVLGYHLAD